jgi:hypothetical protein
MKRNSTKRALESFAAKPQAVEKRRLLHANCSMVASGPTGVQHFRLEKQSKTLVAVAMIKAATVDRLCRHHQARREP